MIEHIYNDLTFRKIQNKEEFEDILIKNNIKFNLPKYLFAYTKDLSLIYK